MTVIFSCAWGEIVTPEVAHISPKEGGHLIVIPKMNVQSRMELSNEDAANIHQLTLIAAKALKNQTHADWFNYQENGNFAVSKSKKNRMHVHIYGRKKGAVKQPFGDPVTLCSIKNIPFWECDNFSPHEIQNLKRLCIREMDHNRLLKPN